jgi:hypothetical protein
VYGKAFSRQGADGGTAGAAGRRRHGRGGRAPAGPGSSGARDEQQTLMLERLRRAGGAPVSYAELREAGVEHPASVVAELQLAGVPLERGYARSPDSPVAAVRLDPARDPDRAVAASRPPRRLALPPLASVADASRRAAGWITAQGGRAVRWRALGTPADSGTRRSLIRASRTRWPAVLGLLAAGGAVVALVVVSLGGGGGRSPTAHRGGAKPSHASTAPVGAKGGGPGRRGAAPTGRPIPIRSATDYDPEGDGTEDRAAAPLAIDGDPTTAWTTEHYDSATFAGTKTGPDPGVGIYVEARSVSRAGRIEVRSPTPGWNAQIFASVGPPPAAITGWGAPVGKVAGAGSRQAIDLHVASPSRYFLLWFTKAAPASDEVGRFEVAIAEVTLIG